MRPTPTESHMVWVYICNLSAHRVQSNLNVKSHDTDKATLSQLLFSVVSLLLKDFPVQMTFTTMSAARWTALPWVPVQTVGFRLWWKPGYRAILPRIRKIFLTYGKLCGLVGGQSFSFYKKKHHGSQFGYKTSVLSEDFAPFLSFSHLAKNASLNNMRTLCLAAVLSLKTK